MNQGPHPSFYLVPPESPIIQEWEAYFKKMDEKAVAWEVEIAHTAVIQQQVQRIRDMFCALQHYPQLIPGQQDNSFILDIPQMKKLVIRVWNACRFFLLYCHYSDFDTRSYIAQMIAEFHMPFTYEHVKAQYEQDVMNGATFRMGKLNEN